jgi:hypothetical protein
MTIGEALIKIKKDWASYPHDAKDGHEAVWIAKDDIAGDYEVDEEWVGMKGDGSLIWAYASGCSCWSGDYKTQNEKTVKAFKLNHNVAPEIWEEAIIKFAKSDGKKEIDIEVPTEA